MNELEQALQKLAEQPNGILWLERDGVPAGALISSQRALAISADESTRRYLQPPRVTRKQRRLRAAERARNEENRLKADKAQRTRQHELNRAKKERPRMTAGVSRLTEYNVPVSFAWGSKGGLRG